MSSKDWNSMLEWIQTIWVYVHYFLVNETTKLLTGWLLVHISSFLWRIDTFTDILPKVYTGIKNAVQTSSYLRSWCRYLSVDILLNQICTLCMYLVIILYSAQGHTCRCISLVSPPPPAFIIGFSASPCSRKIFLHSSKKLTENKTAENKTDIEKDCWY